MKKSIILIILMILMLSVSVFGADRIDMIVLLDNSVSVLPFYDQIQKSLLGKIISEHLKPGDTFSLITFADVPEVEISREIKNQGDIEEILAYSSILQPMGNYTDLVLALRFLYKYTLDLPLNNRKKIIILTDGIHDPPEGSSYIYSSPEDARIEIKKAGDEIHREGWDVSIVEIEKPETAEPDAGTSAEAVADLIETPDKTGETGGTGGTGETKDFIGTVSESLGSKPNVFTKDENDMAGVALGIPLVSLPEHLGETNGELIVPLKITNRSNEALLFSVSAVLSDGGDILKDKTSLKLNSKETGKLNIGLVLPDVQEAGEKSREIELKLVGGLKSSPEKLTLRYTFMPKGNLNRGIDFISDWRVIAVIIAVIVAAAAVVLIKKASFPAIGAGNDEKSPEQTHAASVPVRKDEKQIKPSGETKEIKIDIEAEPVFATDRTAADEHEQYHKNRPIKMIVYGQNTKLGIANTQWLTVNKKRSIGSAPSSSYRIFFIKVPALIARIECTGEDFIFYPEAADFFPELDGPLHNCLNRRIKIINEDHKMFFIEFRQWVSELERINRFLSMTHYTGKPDLDF